MAAVSPSDPSPCAAWLTEHQISALSGCVSRILEDIWPRLQSDTDASDAIFAVNSAVQFACAQFASSFNDRNPRAVTSRLPVELLTACLYAADMPTRIRASHVSHSWRALALAERGLWTEYRISSFPWKGKGLRPSLGLLDAIVRRSDPLPFRLKLSHNYRFGNDPFSSEAAAIVTPHLHRLQEYDGSGYLFWELNRDETPMRALVSLDTIGDGIRERIYISSPSPPQCFPNLRRLVGPVFHMTGQCYSSLTELVCSVNDEQSADLFLCCPNLVRAEFYGWKEHCLLPRGPVPRTIQEITLHGEPCLPDGPDGIDFAALRAWAGERIPQLTLLGAHSLDAIVRELLVAHNEPISLAIAPPGIKQDVILAAEANPSLWRWAVSTRDLWGSSHCAGDLQQLFTAVKTTSLNISIDMLNALLAARLDAPHLLSLELVLTGPGDAALSEVPPESDSHCLRAPGLQHFVLDFGATNAGARAHGINDALEALAQNFRRLIVYEAELLETVTVRSSARAAEGTDCASFARFASRYVEIRRP